MAEDAAPQAVPQAAEHGAAKGPFLLAALAVLALDQWTKWLVEAHLPQHASVEIWPSYLNFTHVRNSGVAFGLFAGGEAWSARLVLAGLGLSALAMVTAYFLRTPAQQRRLLLALSLVLGGALGNLLDRFASGAVTDFLDFSWRSHHWPAFNVADGAITVGLALLAFDALRAEHPIENGDGGASSGTAA
jgi:signal peptidase II